jgi:two-component sensor histidine kinase
LICTAGRKKTALFPTSDKASAPLASEQVFRTLAVAVGAGGTMFNLLAVQLALGENPTIRPWFADSSMAILWGVPIVLALLAPFASLSILRALATTTAIGFPIALALWVPNMTVSVAPSAASPWLLNVIAVSTSMAALAWSARLASAYTVIVCFGGGLLRFASLDRGNATITIQHTLYMLFISVMFLALIQATRRLAGQLDAAAAAATNEAARAGRNRATERENARFNALVHDDVITTLLAAARKTNDAGAMLRQQATKTLVKLEEISSGRIRTKPYTAEEFVARLRSTVTDQTSGIGFDVHITSALPIDAAVALAMSEALAEGLRNSLQHATPKDGRSPVSRSVEVEVSPDGVLVRLRDSGAGFVASRVGPERLGIAVSITGRMAAQPGGYSSVEPGNDGTVVILGWKRP